METPENNLAKAKILTMFYELGGWLSGLPSKNREQNIKRRRDYAYWWFTSKHSDFEDWCITAGLDPDYVRGKADNIYKNGLPKIRAEAGKGARFEERCKYRLKNRKPLCT